MAKVYLVGVGMGNPDTLTLAAQKAIQSSQLLIGAPRLLEPYQGQDCIPLILASDIAQAVENSQATDIAVLLSGDVGFYSGAKNLYPLLSNHQVEAIPGISSLIYFAARLQRTWQNLHLVSAHGRSHNALGEIASHESTFLLTGGQTKVVDLCRQLVERDMDYVTLSVGERLSYPDEKITQGHPSQLLEQDFDSLAVVVADNPHPVVRAYTAPTIPDEAFQRGQVPMTKAEVRALVVSKLKPKAHHVIWDVGAGTGSVSVECALAVPEGQVYAIERKPEGIELIKENSQIFGAYNLTAVAGLAPEALLPLPAPDGVFLGGTAGNMREILDVALGKNPKVRIVVTAVTLETVAETTSVFRDLDLAEVDMVQISATKTRKAGSYHLFQAQNPVWMFSGEGRG